MQPTSPLPRLHEDLTVGPVQLSVSNLEHSLAFYRQVLGLRVLSQDHSGARLGVADRVLLSDRVLLILQERPGVRPPPQSSTGLFHFALLLPSRADLARFVHHCISQKVPLGQGDHWVSEAFYLNDPDGHGIEVYTDRPREDWKWQAGEVQMGTDPVDMPSLLAEAGPETPWAGLPGGTVMGHIHLKVSNLASTEAFYCGVLGFDVMNRWSGQALFLSVGGYHHHLGLNTWQSAGGRPPPEASAHLEKAWLHLPNAEEIGRVAEHLRAAGVPFEQHNGGIQVRDPSGNLLHFSVQ
jgi:catechol 2,3-dioxygenase